VILSLDNFQWRAGERRVTMIESNLMGRYQSGEHVKFEVVEEHSDESEWLWLSVRESDDEREIVFGMLDSQPVVMTSMKLGQEFAISYDKVRDHRRFTQQENPRSSR
jgi:uncharacterized protein YegJ (DUF2314 family)